MMLHPLPSSVRDVESPVRFTYPFCYEPHPLCLAAAEEVRQYVLSQSEWKKELTSGKMFGVLIVQQGDERGYLAAFSGTLGGKTIHSYFVPPVFDLMAPGCYFQVEQNNISSINKRIEQLQHQLSPSPLREQMRLALDAFRSQMQEDKVHREHLRQTLSPEELCKVEPQLIRQSQFQKAELRRMQRDWEERIRQDEAPVRQMQAEIQALGEERHRRSIQLQQWLFDQFHFCNAKSVRMSLMQVFHPLAPPGGAGDCCAPKLLQAAYLNGMKPLCMAEFWIGGTTVGEVRRDGQFYPACNSKCRPILRHMLQGLDVEANPLQQDYDLTVSRLRLIYNDVHIAVVLKPSGMLSVPGKDDLPSVCSVMRERFPDATGPLIVHRLDMDTSGLMVIALNEASYQHLQQQFASRQVHKMYVALLQHPMPVGQEGDIRLPLSPDYLDRPRQQVDYERGKQADTHYCVLSVEQGHARVALWPHTGRTHQLRVHCAHPDGLGNPIVGDRLYGQSAERLMLHAQQISFKHPVTGKEMIFEGKQI